VALRCAHFSIRRGRIREVGAVRRWAGMAAATSALILCGCGSDDAALERAAASFGAALSAGDGVRACELLAPATRATLEFQQPQPCPQVLLSDNLGSGPVLQVEVWGGEARARTSSDTWFLTRTSQGWRIAAAGCVPQGDNVPYLCKVSGP
jgi:hypothetical protein